MFVSSNVPTFHAVLRKFIYSFMCRLNQSKNGVIMALAVPAQSDTKYLSDFWKHWHRCLYVI